MHELVENIFKALRYGIPKNKGTIYDLRGNGFQQLKPPVFFLSTGRCGTKWFTELLSFVRTAIVEHDPVPDLGVQGKLAYEIQNDSPFQNKGLILKYLQELFLAGREEQLRYAYKTDKRYIETNNHITFFAPAIAELFPESKFVHLYRHPGQFVRSAIRRHYYSKDDNRILKRIIPSENSEYSQRWDSFSPIQKSSWLWFETNRFAENFKEQISETRIFNVNFNERNEDTLSRLIAWIQLDISESKIQGLLHKEINVQKEGQFVRYEKWNSTQRQELIQICGNLAEQYGFEL